VGALDNYNARTRRLLTDGKKQFWSDSDLNQDINDARIRIAGDTKCLRQLVTDVMLPAGQEVYNIVETINRGLPPNRGLDVVEVVSVTIYWGTMRVKCRNLSFTEQDTKLRAFQFYATRPGSLAMMGANTVYINPVPDMPYNSDWDVVLVPQPLTTNSDLEVLPIVFQRLVPWYAAHLAKFGEQSISESDVFYQKYGKELTAAMYAFFGMRVRDAYRR
jgi:hypothetical protein